MIAHAIPPASDSNSWHEQFLEMLPKMREYADRAFRRLNPEAREDAVQEVLANAAVALGRLIELGKADLAFPTVLARYGIAQVRAGRRVGSRLRVSDVLSPYAQRKKGFVVERLDRRNKETGEWAEAVVEDHRTPVPDQAAFRIDFPAWLNRHKARTRRIAETLALGHSTSEVAKWFHVSSGRISQLRRELHESWQSFHGDPAPA